MPDGDFLFPIVLPRRMQCLESAVRQAYLKADAPGVIVIN